MLAIWLAVIVIAIAAEVATSLQLISIWAACGGLGALIAYLCGAELYIQIVVFFAVTFILLALTRPLVRKLTKNIKNTPTNAVRRRIPADCGYNVARIGRCCRLPETKPPPRAYKGA